MAEFSIIIPTYNRESFLIEAINSVLSQAEEICEITVIDDGSIDSTQNKLRKFKNRIKYFYQNNSGVSAARNFGFKQSSGKYVIFLDSDDILCKDMIRTCFEIFEKDTDCMVVYGKAAEFNANGHISQVYRYDSVERKNGNAFRKIIEGKNLLLAQVAMRRECFEEVGGFRNDLIYGEDWEFFLKLSRKFPFYYVPVEFARRRIHDEIRGYRNKEEDAISERIKIIKETFVDNPEEILKEYITKTVLADWHRCIGLAAFQNNEMHKGRVNLLKSLRYRPLQLPLYFNLLYQGLPYNIKKQWRSLKT